MTTIRSAFLILLALIATSCSHDVVGTASEAVPVSSNAEQATGEALFDPCSIPVTALNAVGMKSDPRKTAESTIPAMVACDFQGLNGTLGVVSTSEGSKEQLTADSKATNFVEYQLGDRTIIGVTMPSRGTINGCIRATSTAGGWVGLYWAGTGDVCALSDTAFIAIDSFLPPPA